MYSGGFLGRGCPLVLIFGLFVPRVFAAVAQCVLGWEAVSDTSHFSISRWFHLWGVARLMCTLCQVFQLVRAKPLSNCRSAGGAMPDNWCVQ